jgi:hypothetical protein
MKKLFAAFILSVGLTPAWAEWELQDWSDSHTLYIKSKVIKSGGTIKGWVMFDRRPGRAENIVSSIRLMEARCNAGQTRVLQTVVYQGQMGSGAVRLSSDKPTEWLYPIPNSIDETIFQTLCAQK